MWFWYLPHITKFALFKVFLKTILLFLVDIFQEINHWNHPNGFYSWEILTRNFDIVLWFQIIWNFMFFFFIWKKPRKNLNIFLRWYKSAINFNIMFDKIWAFEWSIFKYYKYYCQRCTITLKKYSWCVFGWK